MRYTFQPYEKTPLKRGHLHLGGANPQGGRIEVTNLYLERDGRPWIPVMGEYHFTRSSRDQWYRELCKMKAGGVTLVATYLLWIYHEEEEGRFDFTGDRDIRAFLLECQRAGLEAMIRIGPWAHGECRNGGFPDWLLKKPFKLRDNNPGYMEKARLWYQQIFQQVKGLFYKDGGMILAVQLENELVNNGEHLLALKRLAQEVGFDVPLWTVTGWDSAYGAKIPVDEVLPVFAAYADAPWADTTEPLPPSHSFTFHRMRNDTAIGADLIDKASPDGWVLPYERYPFATCELGGGIQVTHHRRPIIRPMDVYALVLCKLGAGNNLPGYYMYHGGTNKLGVFSTLNETRESGYPNDYPILSYDFQAPLSEYGEARGQYGLLNMLHLFLQDFGELLAPMEAVEAQQLVPPQDFSSLRYALRTDGEKGFVFVNHYQRRFPLEDVEDAVIDTGAVSFPPLRIQGETAFFLPCNLPLGGERLTWATAQLLCAENNTYFFAAVPGIPPQYALEGRAVLSPKPGLAPVSVGDIQLVTLTWEQAQYLRRLSGGLYLGAGCNLYEENGRVSCVEAGSFSYFHWTGKAFERHQVERPFRPAALTLEPLKTPPFSSPYLSELSLGGERSLSWYRLSVSTDQGFVEISAPCDVGQIYGDGQLIADNFYYGVPWRVPARLLYGRECCLVLSELRDDFYREF